MPNYYIYASEAFVHAWRWLKNISFFVYKIKRYRIRQINQERIDNQKKN